MYTIAENYNQQKAHRFTMILGIVSICMAFGGLTSAYIVRKGAGNWVDFSMPTAFYTSTIILLISSATMHVAHISNKKGYAKMTIFTLLVTIALGLMFAFFQYQGWQELTNTGIYLDGNPSGSFFYVITGMHAVHLLGGVLFLIFAFLNSIWIFAIKKQETTIGENKALKVRTDLLSMYWHFMDILWIYLFIFLFINLNQ
jgi:cytochrome c oxidase subunit 3